MYTVVVWASCLSRPGLFCLLLGAAGEVIFISAATCVQRGPVPVFPGLSSSRVLCTPSSITIGTLSTVVVPRSRSLNLSSSILPVSTGRNGLILLQPWVSRWVGRPATGGDWLARCRVYAAIRSQLSPQQLPRLGQYNEFASKRRQSQRRFCCHSTLEAGCRIPRWEGPICDTHLRRSIRGRRILTAAVPRCFASHVAAPQPQQPLLSHSLAASAACAASQQQFQMPRHAERRPHLPVH
ncbi:hypothetical protein EJ04DRAFT_554009 [Polyplosphaeria fusca]|uniref:Uncharacterized protein n=1 Tax=Polyplosphaeria fusca TaxID=682080 RepID=A0A9P4QWB4_9PLEO|nr:hypothetical protein EJ04DRAFT_554009 [Polyplosphaeria fusca]